jgi:hypothetical protein
MRMTRICANTANDDTNENHNPNYPNLYEFTNNTNENKLIMFENFKIVLRRSLPALSADRQAVGRDPPM